LASQSFIRLPRRARPKAQQGSGAKLARPELFRLIADSKPGDVLLIEQVDRLSRLTDPDWRKLRTELDAKQIRVVALDLPTSWQLAAPAGDFTARMFAAINAMVLDMLAAVVRKDYDDRRRRQAQGVAKAKAEGKYLGRPKTQAATLGLLRCYALVRRGRRFRPRPDAAERQSPRSPSERCPQPSTGPPRSQRRPPLSGPQRALERFAARRRSLCLALPTEASWTASMRPLRSAICGAMLSPLRLETWQPD
jgi:hypothetical protein